MKLPTTSSNFTFFLSFFFGSGSAAAAGWVADGITPGLLEWAGLALVCVILPAVVSLLVNAGLRRAGIIRDGDMALES